jgi:hypothetical protein
LGVRGAPVKARSDPHTNGHGILWAATSAARGRIGIVPRECASIIATNPSGDSQIGRTPCR